MLPCWVWKGTAKLRAITGEQVVGVSARAGTGSGKLQLLAAGRTLEAKGDCRTLTGPGPEPTATGEAETGMATT